jgi:hypothetical protein
VVKGIAHHQVACHIKAQHKLQDGLAVCGVKIVKMDAAGQTRADQQVCLAYDG